MCSLFSVPVPSHRACHSEDPKAKTQKGLTPKEVLVEGLANSAQTLLMLL